MYINIKISGIYLIGHRRLFHKLYLEVDGKSLSQSIKFIDLVSCSQYSPSQSIVIA